MEKIGYKCVSIDPTTSKMVSTWATGLIQLEYQVGKETKPIREELPILLFKTLKAAKESDIGKIILKCKYKESSIKQFVFANGGHAQTPEDIDIIVKKQKDPEKQKYCQLVHGDVVLASSVTPIEKVRE